LTVVEAAKPDVIRITDSWGNDDISDSELSIPGGSNRRFSTIISLYLGADPKGGGHGAMPPKPWMKN